jgi:hypothetical protein
VVLALGAVLAMVVAIAPAGSSEASSERAQQRCKKVNTQRGWAVKVVARNVSCGNAATLARASGAGSGTGERLNGYSVRFRFVPDEGSPCEGFATYHLIKGDKHVWFSFRIDSRALRC